MRFAILNRIYRKTSLTHDSVTKVIIGRDESVNLYFLR